MDNQSNNTGLNELEKQIQEINEWQYNANNPGYFIGTGKVPAPVKNLYRAPIVMIIIGSILFLPVIFGLITDFNMTAVTSNLVGVVVGFGFIVGGIIRMIKR